MALNTSEIQIGAAAMAADINFMTTHSSQPDASGSNRTSASAVAVTATATGGSISIGSTAFTGIAANGAVTHVGFWHGDPAASGTFRGWQALTGDQTANAAGQYTVDSVTVAGSAT